MEEFHQLTNQPIVIDNGSGTIKAGVAGDEVPKCIFPTVVGVPKHVRVMAGAMQGGNNAMKHRGILKLKYPLEHGIVTDWNDMERIWFHLYDNELELQKEEHPVLLTECPHNPKTNREKAAQIFFETFSVPAFFVSIQAVLSLYASGCITGVVLDSGDGVTQAVPVYEGFAIPNAIQRIDVAGRDVSNYLMLLLRKGGIYRFHTSAEKEVVRQIKESKTTVYVAYNYDKEEELEEKGEIETVDYKLPDGNILKIGPERYRAPELLFKPYLIGLEYMGVHECLISAIVSSDLDIRKKLYSSIYLAGGSTLFEGFGDRLLIEVSSHSQVPKDAKIRINAPPERKYTTWIGGSILASLGTFSTMWVSAAEYKEYGPSIIHKKTFV